MLVVTSQNVDQAPPDKTSALPFSRTSEVKNEREGDEHVVRGNWVLGRSKDTFKFNVPDDNLNVFWGEFSFEQGRTVARDGIRKPSARGTLRAP